MKLKNFLEKFIIAAIILALIQAFLDEYSRFEHWSVLARNTLLIAGLTFDFLFSVEFIVKIIVAAREKRASVYWKHERGWIDLLTSLPLFLLSLPSVYFALYGSRDGASAIAFYNVLIFLKDTRAARILRFARILKLSGKIKISGSPMAEHHVSVICTTAVFTIISALIVFSLFASPIDHRILERAQFFDESISTIKYLEGRSKVSYSEIAKKLFTDEKNLLKLANKDEIIISRISDEKFSEYYSQGDYALINNRGFVLHYSIVDINRELAYGHIIFFIIIIFTVLSVVVFYKRHFTQTVSDVINVVNKGFKSRQYNEPAIIRNEYEQDEVFKLAKFYNDAYLPAKIKRIVQKQGEDNKTAGN